MRNIIAAFTILFFLFTSITTDLYSQETAPCNDKKDVFKQLSCFVSSAVEMNSAEICTPADHEGVRLQCYAIYAEKKNDPDICELITASSNEHIELRSLCLSDVAVKRADDAMCDRVQTDGIRDGCYLKIFNKTNNAELCSRIIDPGIFSLCSGKPVYVE